LVTSLPPFPSNTLPILLIALARGFIIIFHIHIWSTSNIFPHLHNIHSPSLHTNIHPYCTYFIVLGFFNLFFFLCPSTHIPLLKIKQVCTLGCQEKECKFKLAFYLAREFVK
jgi:hypothetical protein